LLEGLNGYSGDVTAALCAKAERTQAFERLAAKAQKQDRRDERIQQCRADEAAEDRNRDWMQDLLAGRRRVDQQWQ
jgi:hypothetical protein